MTTVAQKLRDEVKECYCEHSSVPSKHRIKSRDLTDWTKKKINTHPYALYKKPMSKGWRKLHNTNTNQNKIEEAINITGLQSKPIARDKSLLNNKWSIYYGQLGTLHLNIHADPLEKGMAPTPVFFPGEFHGQRSLASYSPWGHRVGHDWVTNTHTISKLKKNTKCKPSLRSKQTCNYCQRFDYLSLNN